MKKILLLLLLIPSLVFAQGSGTRITQESQHPLRHKANKIDITDSGSYYTGTQVEAALQELGAGTAGAFWTKSTDQSSLSGTKSGTYNLSTSGTLGAGAITSSTLTTGYLPVISTAGLLINSAGTGFVKVTAGVASYDNSTYYKSGDSPTFAKVITSQTMTVSITAPNDVYTVNNLIPIRLSTLYAITVTKVNVSCDADPATEITGDLKYADAMIGLANSTLINAIDTTAGVYTSGTLAVSVAAGKFIYIVFDAAPSSLIKNLTVEITYTY